MVKQPFLTEIIHTSLWYIILFVQCWINNLNISLYIYYTYVHASYQSVVFLSCNIFSMVMLVLMKRVRSFPSPCSRRDFVAVAMFIFKFLVVFIVKNVWTWWAFMLVWLEVGLFLTFSVVVESGGFKFPYCPCFCLLFPFLTIITSRAFVFCSFFSSDLLSLHWSPSAGVKDEGGECSLIHLFRCLFPCPLHRWGRKLRGVWNWGNAFPLFRIQL